MLKDITVGRYVNKDSFLHRLDPRGKIAATVVYSILSLSCDSYISMAAIGAFTVLAAVLSRLPMRYIIKGIKPLRWFILFTVIVNLLSVSGDIILHIGPLNITREGVSTAFFTALRFIFFVTGTSLLTLTTSPIALTDALARIMHPLSKLGFPADDIAMIISITLRSIPAFADEADRIMKAQRARGADFSKGTIISRIRAIMPVTVPLFISVFRRADELSLAMEARCYGKGSRTPRKKSHFKKNDTFMLIAMIILCGISAIIEFYN